MPSFILPIDTYRVLLLSSPLQSLLAQGSHLNLTVWRKKDVTKFAVLPHYIPSNGFCSNTELLKWHLYSFTCSSVLFWVFFPVHVYTVWVCAFGKVMDKVMLVWWCSKQKPRCHFSLWDKVGVVGPVDWIGLRNTK